MDNVKDYKAIQKSLKKKYPDQESMFASKWIDLMRLRKELWIVPEEEKPKEEKVKEKEKKEKPAEDHLYFYNSAIHVRTAENQDTILKKSILQIIRNETVVSMAGIIHDLEKRAYERSLDFDYNLVPEILEEFKDKGYITIT